MFKSNQGGSFKSVGLVVRLQLDSAAGELAILMKDEAEWVYE